MRKMILQHLATVAVMMITIAGIKQAQAQTIWPVVNDVTIGMCNGMGITTRYEPCSASQLA